METFTLTINLGNEAMQTAEDVAEALHRLAERLSNVHDVDPPDAGKVMDLNGNAVGRWELK